MSELNVQNLRTIWELEALLEKAKKSRDKAVEKVRDLEEELLNLERRREFSI